MVWTIFFCCSPHRIQHLGAPQWTFDHEFYAQYTLPLSAAQWYVNGAVEIALNTWITEERQQQRWQQYNKLEKKIWFDGRWWSKKISTDELAKAIERIKCAIINNIELLMTIHFSQSLREIDTFFESSRASARTYDWHYSSKMYIEDQTMTMTTTIYQKWKKSFKFSLSLGRLDALSQFYSVHTFLRSSSLSP